MTEQNQDNVEMAQGVPSGAPKKQVAEGQSEFSVRPEEFMKLLGDDQTHMDPNNAKKLAGMNEGRQPQQGTQRNHSTGDPDKDAMADILTKFHAAEQGGHTGQSQAPQTQPQQPIMEQNVQEAEYTVLNEEWQVKPVLNEKNPNKPLFSVQHSQTGSVIANGLRLYESAQKLTEALNNGHYINSPQVSEILYYEEIYKDSSQKAGHYKKKMRRLGESKDLKGKYNDQVREAKKARASLKKLIL